jgi:hypothetical protein
MVIVKMRKADGSMCKTDAESAEVFRQHLDKLYNASTPYDQAMVDQIVQRPIDASLNSVPSQQDILRNVKKMKGGKSPGDNGIPPEAFKALIHDDATLSVLEGIILDFWQGNVCYEEWLVGRLKLLPKKGDLKNPNNWRGIMLLDISGKIVASILSERLQGLLMRHGIECQNGFSRLRGCPDALFSLKMALQKRREHKRDTWVLFVDLIKAFDTVNRGALVQILQKMGVPQHFADLVAQLHMNTSVRFKIGPNGDDIEFSVSIGVKQGDNMAPILFLFYMQAAIEAMEREWTVHKPQFHYKADSKLTSRDPRKKEWREGTIFDFWASLYADDGGFLFCARDDITDGSNQTFSTLEKFGLRMHVSGKTEAMYVPWDVRTYSQADTSNISVANGFVPFTEQFRYLGSLIHYSLSDELDVDHRISAAGAAFGSLSCILCARRTSYTRKGQIYQVLVQSILLYGSECWALSAALLRKLISFHSKCVRRMCRVTLVHTQEHRIRTSSLEDRLGIPSIQETIDDLRMRWIGHVARMPVERLPRRFLTSWVRHPRRQGGQQMSTAWCFKDTIRRAGLDPEEWIEFAQDRSAWRSRCIGIEPKLSNHRRPNPPSCNHHRATATSAPPTATAIANAAKRRAQRAGIEAAGHSAGCVCGGFFDAATCERKRAETAAAKAKHTAATTTNSTATALIAACTADADADADTDTPPRPTPPPPPAPPTPPLPPIATRPSRVRRAPQRLINEL